jgi:hypothetical protein
MRGAPSIQREIRASHEPSQVGKQEPIARRGGACKPGVRNDGSRFVLAITGTVLGQAEAQYRATMITAFQSVCGLNDEPFEARHDGF